MKKEELTLLLVFISLLILLLLTTCNVNTVLTKTKNVKKSYEQMDDYVTLEEKAVEVVTDEYDHQYLKQHIGDEVIYIPYPFVDDASESDETGERYVKKN